MKFLSALWPDAGSRSGDLTLWFTPPKTSHHFAVNAVPTLTADDLTELREQVDRDSLNVYFGLGLRREGLAVDQQGGKKDVIALPAFALDIDFYNPKAHKAHNLPRDLDEATPVLFPEGLVPDPSCIIDTGNGVHVYWFFKRAIELVSNAVRASVQKAFKAFQQAFIDRANAVGWQLDLTATVQRVWRLPGFLNRKTNKLVKVLYLDADTRYEPAELGVGEINADQQSTSVAVSTVNTANTPPTHKPDLDVVIAALKTIKSNNRYYDAIQKALAGESMAERGSRDEVLQGVCSTIAWLPEGRQADPIELAEVLRESLQQWANEEDATKTVDEEIAKAADKIERSQTDWHEQQQEKRPELDALARALGGKTGNGVPNAFFERHAIIQKRNAYYVFDFALARYSVPKTKEELPLYLQTAWEQGPIKLHYVNGDGTKKEKPLAHMLKQNGTNADLIVGDLTLEESRYDPKERTFYEAMARRRVTEALFDKEIDEWLRLLVGDAVTTDGTPVIDKVLDWIAAVPQLEHQCCVLYLDGVSGSGKGLLANGLSRLWTTGGPTPFANVLGDFNSDIVECPLLFADEGIPSRKGNVSAELRALIGSSKLTLNEKYMTPRKVNGSVRLLLAANNDEALLFGNENLTVHDLEAVVGRFLHVDAQREAARWLKAKNHGGHLTRAWVEGDLLAKHCLALAETRTIKRGKRFLVEGDETRMHRKLLMQGVVDGAVHEWLVRFATKPSVVATRYKGSHEAPKAVLENGQVFVNSQCVIDCWDAYMSKQVQVPTTRKVGHALKRLSHRQTRRGKPGSRAWYHVIDPDLIIELSQEMQVGSEEQIQANLDKAAKDAQDAQENDDAQQGDDNAAA